VTELLIVAALIVLNGLFALSELAVVSSRHPRLKALAASGRKGANRALALASDPGRFLSAVQIGITLIGLVNGAYAGETLGEDATNALKSAGVPEGAAAPLGYGLVIAFITYLSVIIGELVPKHLALRNAEAIACTVAPAMTLFATAAASGALDIVRLAFRLFGQSTEQGARHRRSRTLIAEADRRASSDRRRQMIAGVMRLADRAIVGVMTPRTDVDWIDITASEREIKEPLITTPHSRLPVGEGSPDALIGVVQTRELLAAMLAGKPFDVRAYVRKAPGRAGDDRCSRRARPAA
jgi:putative hemolysin